MTDWLIFSVVLYIAILGTIAFRRLMIVAKQFFPIHEKFATYERTKQIRRGLSELGEQMGMKQDEDQSKT